MKNIPYGRQNIDKDDIRSVVNVLGSDWITQGPTIAEFEKAIAKYCGSKYAVAVSSGTAALHLTCLAAGLGKGDEAITTPMTFLATANSVLYAGAKPVFADIDKATLNIDPSEIKRKITRRTKAILPVHFAGLPCRMEEISSIAKKHNLIVIEDACHALGAKYKSKGKWVKIGSCKHSDMTVLSFHPVKHITTGEGGAITTNSKKLYEKLLALRAHGIYKTPAMMKKYGSWYYEMQELGFNYRITDFQCALGLSQLKKLDGFLAKRRRLAGIYDNLFEGLKDIHISDKEKDYRHAYHLYILNMDFNMLKIGRKKLMNKLKEKGILTQVHYIPVHLQPYYKEKFGYKKGCYPNAEKYYEGALSIPIYPDLEIRKVRYIAKNIMEELAT